MNINTCGLSIKGRREGQNNMLFLKEAFHVGSKFTMEIFFTGEPPDQLLIESSSSPGISFFHAAPLGPATISIG